MAQKINKSKMKRKSVELLYPFFPAIYRIVYTYNGRLHNRSTFNDDSVK